MRIAIITSSFTDSTLGLTEALSSYGHSVDLYFCVFNKKVYQFPCFEINVKKRKFSSIRELADNTARGISFIKHYPQSHIYLYQGYPLAMNSKGLLFSILRYVSKETLKELGKNIQRKKYDAVDIISQNDALHNLEREIRGSVIIHSFHEILRQHYDDRQVLPIIESLLNRGSIIRVFSDKAKGDIIENYQVSHSNLFNIPFGVYNSYRDFGGIIMPELKGITNYVLFFGNIHPYKGLSLLYSASKKIISKDIKFVVAGKGNDSCLDYLKKDSKYIVINRSISNDELVFLFSNCRVVVCPYLSVSQSGIPQTALFFKKPIIATNLGTFSSLIIDKKTGLLTKLGDEKDLADAIEKLYFDKQLYHDICQWLERGNCIAPEFEWANIAEKYTQMVCELKNR